MAIFSSRLKRFNKLRSEFGTRFYSQSGEDAIVKYIFQLRNIFHPSYLDIGAHHPYYLSNTAFFYENGSRGINVEANPTLLNQFKIDRPEDVNINIGVAGTTGEMEFFILNDPSLSTFSKEEAEKMVNQNGFKIVESKMIKLQSIDYILENYSKGVFPDFLSLDVEGFDFEIIRSINFNKHWPKIICCESAEYSPIGAGARRDDLIDYIKSKGYYEYANTNLNSILVKNEFWFI